MKYLVAAFCFAFAMSSDAQPLPDSLRSAGVTIAEYNEVAADLGMPTIVTPAGAPLPDHLRSAGVTVAEWDEMMRRWRDTCVRDEDEDDNARRRRGF